MAGLESRAQLCARSQAARQPHSMEAARHARRGPRGASSHLPELPSPHDAQELVLAAGRDGARDTSIQAEQAYSLGGLYLYGVTAQPPAARAGARAAGTGRCANAPDTAVRGVNAPMRVSEGRWCAGSWPRMRACARAGHRQGHGPSAAGFETCTRARGAPLDGRRLSENPLGRRPEHDVRHGLRSGGEGGHSVSRCGSAD
jgi:hypothetical protein